MSTDTWYQVKNYQLGYIRPKVHLRMGLSGSSTLHPILIPQLFTEWPLSLSKWYHLKTALHVIFQAKKVLLMYPDGFSENHRMVKSGRKHTGSSGLTSLLKQGHPREHCTELCSSRSWISPLRERISLQKKTQRCWLCEKCKISTWIMLDNCSYLCRMDYWS